MKLFEMPYIEVTKFTIQDVITTSVDEEEEGPMIPAPGLNCI